MKLEQMATNLYRRILEWNPSEITEKMSGKMFGRMSVYFFDNNGVMKDFKD